VARQRSGATQLLAVMPGMGCPGMSLHDQAEQLLQPLDVEEARLYHTSMLKRIQHGQDTRLCVEVCNNVGGGKGKGLIANQDIDANTVLFRDAPLVRHHRLLRVVAMPLACQKGRNIAAICNVRDAAILLGQEARTLRRVCGSESCGRRRLPLR
jgi:hypothetical protein